LDPSEAADYPVAQMTTEQDFRSLILGTVAIAVLTYLAPRIPRRGYRLAGYAHKSTLALCRGEAPMHWHSEGDDRHEAVYFRVARYT
jgi:hypothetical protein